MQPGRELKTLGKYRLIASIGKGGMAKVYLALMAGPAGFNKLLVIKVLHQDLEGVLGSPADRVRMFWEEARLAARLSHPNIVQTHEVAEVSGRHYIAMEYLDGQSYGSLLTRARSGEVPASEHLRIVSEVARALHYAHTLRSYQGDAIGVVHRDISPHNIAITYDGQVKLLDFGVATTEDPEHVTRVGVIKGKLDYIAPEQLRGETIDGRADIFALGVVLWEALSGQRFAGGRKVADANKVQARLMGSERPLGELVPTLPPELVRIVACATSLEPGARFPDAASFADAIDAYLTTLPERPSAKSLSNIMLSLFESERAQLHELINRQLQLLKSERPSVEIGDTTGNLPHITQPQAEEGSSAALRASSVSSVRTGSARPRPPMASSAAGLSAVRRHLQLALLTVGMMGIGASITMLWPPMRAPSASAPALPPELSHPLQPAGTQAGSAAVTAPESPRPRTAEAATIALRIEVSPASASLKIDGRSVRTPFSGHVGRDAQHHAIEVAADGYRPTRQYVTFDRDQALVLALERLPTTTSVRRPSSAVSRRVESAPERRDAPVTPAEAAPPAAAPEAAVPGADIDVATSAAADIYQANPYRDSN